ncbi:ATP-binding protein [Thalassotalea ganghwensis]
MLTTPSVTLGFSIKSLSTNEDKILRIALPENEAMEEMSPQLTLFLKEFWQIWAIDNQTNIQFIEIPLVESYQALKTNEVDIVAISILPKNTDGILLSIPYAKLKQKLFKKINNSSNAVTNLAIHSPGQSVLQQLNEGVNKTYFLDLDSLFDRIDEFDAIYSISPWKLEKLLEQKKLKANFHISKDNTPEISFHFVTRDSDRELMLNINQSIRMISPDLANIWRKKYTLAQHDEINLLLGNYLTELTEQEQNLLLDQLVVTYPLPRTSFPPYLIPSNGQDIVTHGFSVDIMRLISEKTGLIFQPIYVDNFQKAYRSVLVGDTDMFGLAEYKAQDPLFAFSKPYLNVNYSMIHRKEDDISLSSSDWNNKLIAVVKDFNSTKELKAQLPDASFINYNSVNEAILGVAQNQADLLVERSLVADYMIKKNRLANLVSEPLLNFRKNTQLSFAFLNRNAQPMQLINRGITAITQAEFDQIYSHWNKSSNVEQGVELYLTDFYRKAKFGIAIATILIIILALTYVRQQRVQQRANKRVNEALAIAEKARLAAEKSAEAKISFLARMSHEIRTPMNGVLGMAEALNFTRLTNDQKELLETLQGSARHLLALLNDVLDFSKMDAGKLTLESVAINFHLLARNMIASYRHIEQDRTLKLHLKVDADIRHYYLSDPTRLNQVLNNLISNAIKFTDKGHVILSIEKVKDYTLDDQHMSDIRVSIKDTGIGISQQKLGTLFSPFIQAEDDTTRKYGGTGLGLSISQEIIRAMNSKIHIYSVEGQGSEFYFTLSLTQDRLLEEPVERRKNNRIVNPEGDQRFKDLKVLVAEDNLVNIKVLTAQLARLGIEADVAYDGAQAFAMHTENHYDIIISDCHMPNMDGFALARQLRQLENNQPHWLIAVTADALAGATEKCIEAGFDDYMAKPCPQEEITNKLNQAYRHIHKDEIDVKP